jgi:hypothetical protein
MPKPVVGRKIKVKGNANVAFVLDVTESMKPCLENLKNNLIELSSKIVDICEKEYNIVSPSISYNVLGFRDLEEDEQWQIVVRDNNFTEDLSEIKNFFDDEKMQPAGGGSEEESALDGLYLTMEKMNLDKPAKVIVLFTDAPTKPTLHPSTTNGVKLTPEQAISVIKETILSGSFRVVIFGPKDVPEFDKIGSFDYCYYHSDEKIESTLKNFNDEKLFKKNVIELIAKTASGSIGGKLVS